MSQRRDSDPNMRSELKLPLFIRNKDFMKREGFVDKERRRRLIRTNSLISMLLGTAMISGAVSTILLAFFVANNNGVAIIPATLIGLLGYRILAAGSEGYMSATDVYEDANP